MIAAQMHGFQRAIAHGLIGTLLLAMPVAPILAAARAAATPAPAASADLGAQVDASNPGTLIQTAACAMLKAPNARRADYRKNPNKVKGLANKNLLPHSNASYSARLVLPRHWN